MANLLEWSRAYTGRLSVADQAPRLAKANDLAKRLQSELKEGILPFLSMPYRPKLEEDMAKVLPKTRPYRHLLLLGIGGSALGCRAIQRAFAPGQDLPDHNGPSVWVADNVGAEQFEALLGKLNPKETMVVCISKSGGTIETIAQYFLVKEWLQKALGASWQQQMIVVTDAKKGYLREEAARFELPSMEVPDYLGGRYSALSAVGLLPAAYLGIDWKALLDGAASVAKPLVDDPLSLAKHPAFALATWAESLMAHDYSQLIFFCYIPQWSMYGPWFAQLWAESLGKEGKGSQPVPATGVTDQHSVNQMFLDGQRDKGCIFLSSQKQVQGPLFGQDLPEKWSWLRGKPFGSLLEAEALGTRMALCKSGVPLVQLEV
ncbi:MAG: glucose-6-phosphate isomerase, partial [Desulfovibrio sp.]|nr:glucose-6-phosphate isomerase [Desulfovibrio sp.]